MQVATDLRDASLLFISGHSNKLLFFSNGKLNNVIEEGRTEVRGRGGKRRKKLQNDVQERRGY
jgi:hypothetical protein